MTQLAWIQLVFFIVLLLLCAYPLGLYIARIYNETPPKWICWLRPIERGIYRLSGIDAKQDMNWKTYGFALLFFNILGFIWLFVLQQLQAHMPFNPQHLGAVPIGLAFNNAASFVTNTDWQAYAGESTLSYMTQMLALTSQNFLSAATGMSLLMVLIRGIVRQRTDQLGHFGVDMVRGVLYILLPLSCVLALVLVSQGVIQTLKPPATIQLIEPIKQHQSILPLGPVASQIAIKQLGSNGGGFFNANGAHPFENPTAVSNFIETWSILLIPAALCISFGVMVGDRRQGWALLIAMLVLFTSGVVATTIAESQSHLQLPGLGVELKGNFEGKEVRIGLFNSALWSIATTSTANGSVNSMLDSYTPLGGMIPLWMMHLGEVVFGGVGSGLYSMLMMVIITVFIAGLMVGRTPEYLGKKIEPFEMKMASLAVLIMPLFVLLITAVSLMLPIGRQSLFNPATHGLTEMLYAWTSMINNNGSAFSGLNADTPYFYYLGGLFMLIGRYGIAIPILAIAGSLSAKKAIPSNSGTLQTATPLFVILLVGVIFLMGALSFLPVLALGPIAEELMYG